MKPHALGEQVGGAVPGVTIVGGGLAGLSLGLALRRSGVSVDVFEAHTYPRHRVCGEFISGRGRGFLEQLGMGPALLAAGAREARSVAFFDGRRLLARTELPEPALCLSRFSLDALLAEEFVRQGGRLHTGVRSTPPVGEPGWVRATGRRPIAVEGGWRWIGLKAHATGVSPRADLEMHFLPDAYVGVCGVEGGRVNVCGLFRSRAPLPELSATWAARLRGPVGSPLYHGLAPGVFDPASFCAVAGLSLAALPAAATPECVIGDALGMIPPVTGNGMSMAFESARHAVRPLTVWSRGETSWAEAVTGVEEACEAAFVRRWRWAAWVQRGVMAGGGRAWLRPVAPLLPWFFRALYARLR